MKRFFSLSILMAFAFPFAGLTSLTAQTAPLDSLHASARPQRVMAPPMETRTAVRLRPSTAEAGNSRSVKPPLKTLPSLSAFGDRNDVHDSASSSHPGHWILLYRTDHCVPCDRLMNVLATSSSSDLRSGVPYTIIVGAKSSSATANLHAMYTTLSNAHWLTDKDRSVFDTLKLKGAPEVLAMDGNRIAWRVSGNLGDPQQVLHLTDSWIAGTAAAEDAAKEKSVASSKSAAASGPVVPVKR